MSAEGKTKLRLLEIPCTVLLVLLVVVPTLFFSSLENSQPIQCDFNVTFPPDIEDTSETSVYNETTTDSSSLCINVCKENPCIRKCCMKNEIFESEDDKECIFDDDNLPLNISGYYDDTDDFDDDDFIPESIDVIYGNPCFFWQKLEILNEFSFLPNGSLITKDNITLSDDEYCLERFEGQDSLVTFVCVDPSTRFVSAIATACFIISSVLYLAILIIFFLEPTLYQVFHGKACLCYVMCLTCVMVSAAAHRILAGISNVVSDALSYVEEIIAFYTLLASFAWLTLLLYPFWSSVRSLKSMYEPDSKTFRKYFAFGFGFPLVYFALVATPLLVFTDILVFVVILFVPVEIMIIVCLMMSITTLGRLHGQDKAATSQANFFILPEDRESFYISVKLVLVVFAAWLAFAVLTVLFVSHPESLVLVTGICGVLEAVGTAYVLVGNRRVKEALRKTLLSSTD